MAQILITSALPYINGVKHLGNLVGSMLPADVHARFRRMQGHDVLFICATDEHGTPAELAALESGQTPREYCDEQHLIQREVYSGFSLSFDYFGRSSSPENHVLTQHFAEQLEDNGLIEERTAHQIYSIDDNRFLPDRYVEGECPRCGYDTARGDQCDRCGSLLDPVDLINPRSVVSGSRNLEIRETRHLYLLQSTMQDRLRSWIDTQTTWTQLARSIAYKWLDEGLKDRAITRDLVWGVPVMRGGAVRPSFEHKVFYVWFDAPIAYISATQQWARATGGDWRLWWRQDGQQPDVRYVQFMGKDNVAFHTVSFPVTLFGSQEPWRTVNDLKAFNWLNWYGGKFSTSRKRGVFMDQALTLLPQDYWRWYLIAHAPENSDSSFTWSQFQATVNKDLADVLGNFVNRVTSLCKHNFGSTVPAGGALDEAETALFSQLDEQLRALQEHHERMEFRRIAAGTRAIWVIANEYLSAAAPWKVIKTDQDRAAAIIRIGLNLCRLMALVAYPIIPSTAISILSSLGEKNGPIGWPKGTIAEILSVLPPGTRSPSLLFSSARSRVWRSLIGQSGLVERRETRRSVCQTDNLIVDPVSTDSRYKERRVKIDIGELKRLTRTARAEFHLQEAEPPEVFWQDARRRSREILDRVPSVTRVAAASSESETAILRYSDLLNSHVQPSTSAALIKEIDTAQLEGPIEGERSHRKKALAILRMTKEGCPQVLGAQWRMIERYHGTGHDIALIVNWNE